MFEKNTVGILLGILTLQAACLVAFGEMPVAFEKGAGIRSAEALTPTRVKVVYGPGFNPGEAVKKPGAFQILSQEDPDFRLGVKAEKVELKGTLEDMEYPSAWNGPKFKRYVVEALLPEANPMKNGKKYWIYVNSPSVTGQTTSAIWIAGKGANDAESVKFEYGIRKVSIITPRIINLSTGPGVDFERLKNIQGIEVVSDDDPDFKDGVAPSKIGRRSHLDFYIPDRWPWLFHQRHELFLILDKDMKSGKTYRVEFNQKNAPPSLIGTSSIKVAFDDKTSINQAIKVNQAGYLPDAESKFAYMGLWMGDLNACDLSMAANFEVRDYKTHKTVANGNVELRRKATYKLQNGTLTPDPKNVKGPETVYKQDLSYEDVYQIDFSSLKNAGIYYIAVPGLGRSFDFKIDKDVYEETFKTVMSGLYHQRCGIELLPPLSKVYRPACHRNMTEYSSLKREGVDSVAWKKLPEMTSDTTKHDCMGGHHDAGDWNPRAHLEIAENLFMLYEMNKDAFRDGQLQIPEKGNGVPDIIDEAFWALNLWKSLQDVDGGVRHGIESEGDPREFDLAQTDSLREFTYAKDVSGSYEFAAVAAQASIILKGLGKDNDAKDFLDRALKAWDWAAANGGDKENDMHVFAAAVLLRATGDTRFDEAFKKHSVFSSNPDSELSVYNKYDQLLGSYQYALADKADPKMKDIIRKAFERTFNSWRKAAETTTYRYMRNPHAPNTWGTGGLPIWMELVGMTMAITNDPAVKKSCRFWIEQTCAFSLGCHPMNMAFTVGLGKQSVTRPLNLLMWSNPDGLIPGLQTQGPGGRWVAGAKGGKGMGDWPAMSLYPSGDWPDLYKYSEYASPGMNEGVVVNQAKTAFAYGLLLPGKK